MIDWAELKRHDRPSNFGDLAQQLTAERMRHEAFMAGFKTDPRSVAHCPEYPEHARHEVWRRINAQAVASRWDQLLRLPNFPQLFEKMPRPYRKGRRCSKRRARLIQGRRYLAARRYVGKSLENLARIEKILFGVVRYGVTKSAEDVVELRAAA